MAKGEPLTYEAAEAIAVNALRFLAEQPETLGRFLALSGIGPLGLRTAAAEPGFLSGVLDFIAAEEKLLLAFAAEMDLSPLLISQAYHKLSRIASE